MSHRFKQLLGLLWIGSSLTLLAGCFKDVTKITDYYHNDFEDSSMNGMVAYVYSNGIY